MLYEVYLICFQGAAGKLRHLEYLEKGILRRIEKETRKLEEIRLKKLEVVEMEAEWMAQLCDDLKSDGYVPRSTNYS